MPTTQARPKPAAAAASAMKSPPFAHAGHGSDGLAWSSTRLH